MVYLDILASAIRSNLSEHAHPPADADGLFRLYAVLGLAKGQSVDSADVHNAWVAWMLARGVNHESLVPFEELPSEVAAQDAPYVEAIRTAMQAALPQR